MTMELNRATVTGQPFPRAADGYDRDAVDRHLAAIADALPAGSEPVVTDAAEAMRSIVEGAEQSARALRATAEREAGELREAARREADAIREKAARESAARVAAARAAVTSLLERVEALGLGVDDSRHHVMRAAQAMAERLSADSEPLVATLRERARALGAELDLIGSGLAAGAAEAANERERAEQPADEPERAEQPADEPERAEQPDGEPERAEQPADEPERAEQPADDGAERPDVGTGLAAGDLDDAARALAGDLPEPRSGAGDAATASPAGDPSAALEGDEPDDAPQAGEPGEGAIAPGSERARLVALELAVTGTPRAETERRLREELSVENPAPILDEVYASAKRDD